MPQTNHKTELKNLYDLLFSKNITANEYYRLRELEEIELNNIKKHNRVNGKNQ